MHARHWQHEGLVSGMIFRRTLPFQPEVSTVPQMTVDGCMVHLLARQTLF
jgi:hypothetical protein